MSGAAMGGRARIASVSVAAVGALVASTVVVLGASDAAFTASTANPGNSWETGSIVIASLTDDDSGTTPATGTAMFSETGLQPGDTGENCITVTSNVAGNLRLYDSAVTNSVLASNLTLTVEAGTGGGFGDCTGFSEVYGSGTALLSEVPDSYAAAGDGLDITAG